MVTVLNTFRMLPRITDTDNETSKIRNTGSLHKESRRTNFCTIVYQLLNFLGVNMAAPCTRLDTAAPQQESLEEWSALSGNSVSDMEAIKTQAHRQDKLGDANL
ncbi:hypothetical protein BTVI_148898 [Pitangus sulphuratus]|nr:hypothetical protein BTVI_148898 [Pitangus sulphuratus]